MPVAIILDTKRRLTITSCEGVVTDHDFLAARLELIGNKEFDPTFDRIWDFKAVTESTVTQEVVAQLVAESPVSQKPISRAVVMSERPAPLDSILYFMNCTRQANRRIAAFPDLEQAIAWIIASRADLYPE